MSSYSLSFDTSPDPWYVIELSFGPEIPKFLKVNYKDSKIGNFPAISNPTDEPFYILDRHKSQIAMLRNSIYYYRDRFANIEPSKGIEWKIVTFGMHPTPIEFFDFYPSSLEKDFGISVDQIYKDDRPVNQTPPAPTPVTILGQYKEKEILLKGTLTYKLNPKYDPKGGVKRLANAGRASVEWDSDKMERLKVSRKTELGGYLLSVVIAVLVSCLFLRLIRTLQMSLWNRRLMGFLWIGASLLYIPIHFRILYYVVTIPSNTIGANIHYAALDVFSLVVRGVFACIVLLPLIFLNSRVRSVFFLNVPSQGSNIFVVIILWILTLLYISPLQMSVYKTWVSRFPILLDIS